MSEIQGHKIFSNIIMLLIVYFPLYDVAYWYMMSFFDRTSKEDQQLSFRTAMAKVHSQGYYSYGIVLLI